MMALETQTDPIDYCRKWQVMAAVAMGIFLATIDGSIVNVALPTLVEAFGTDFASVQWVVLAYLLTITTLMLAIGRLADMIGKKLIYALGFVVFTVGSVLCGLSPSVGWLIGFRVLQAIGAAMITALGIAIVTEAFPPEERGKALGISGAVVSVGIVLGPTLGGVLIDALSWHWIFFVNLPVGIVGTLLAWRVIPNTRPRGGERFDFPGAMVMFASLISLLVGLTLGQRLGFGDGRVIALLAASVAAFAGFLGIERRAAFPMVDLRLFQDRLFSINLVTGLATFFAIAGAIILMPFYLENVLGYDPIHVGLLLAVVPVGLGVMAPISGVLSDRVGTRPITVAGLGILLVGYCAISTLGTGTTAAGYILRFLPIGLGMGIFQSPNNSAIMGAAPRERLGVASGLLSLSRTLGQTTGIAVLGALWAGRVFVHADIPRSAGATSAPAAAQVAALHDTFLTIAGLIAAALALSIWGLVQERREQARATLASQPA